MKELIGTYFETVMEIILISVFVKIIIEIMNMVLTI